MDRRMECMAKREAYVTLNDHKDNFTSTLPFQLINPTKSEIGIMSNSILNNILTTIRQKVQLNMWKSTSAVTDWFTRTQRKQQCTFVLFDIVDFYLSISEELLKRALQFASQYTTIFQQDREIILHVRKSMLFEQGKEWMKKRAGLFDVTMGSSDGAEVCELVAAFALSILSDKLSAGDIGLYRDDGLGVFWDVSGHASD